MHVPHQVSGPSRPGRGLLGLRLAQDQGLVQHLARLQPPTGPNKCSQQATAGPEPEHPGGYMPRLGPGAVWRAGMRCSGVQEALGVAQLAQPATRT